MAEQSESIVHKKPEIVTQAVDDSDLVDLKDEIARDDAAEAEVEAQAEVVAAEIVVERAAAEVTQDDAVDVVVDVVPAEVIVLDDAAMEVAADEILEADDVGTDEADLEELSGLDLAAEAGTETLTEISTQDGADSSDSSDSDGEADADEEEVSSLAEDATEGESDSASAETVLSEDSKPEDSQDVGRNTEIIPVVASVEVEATGEVSQDQSADAGENVDADFNEETGSEETEEEETGSEETGADAEAGQDTEKDADDAVLIEESAANLEADIADVIDLSSDIQWNTLEDLVKLRNFASSLHREVEKVGRDRDTHIEDLRRMKAEFDNFRKRMLREKSDVVERANISLVEALLPAVDSLEMAFLSSTAENPLHPGLEAVCAQVIDILSKEGLERIEPVKGCEFDPALMEPVVHRPAKDGNGGQPVVTKMLRCGYRMRGRLLRAAMVEVEG